MATAKKATAPKKRSKAAKAAAPAQANTETTPPAADAILEAPSPEAVTEDAATASVQATPEEEAQRAGIANFTQLRVDTDKFARSINKDGSLPMELPEAERKLQALIDRAVEGKNIRVATEEDMALVAATEGERPSSILTVNGVTYFAPGYAKETIRKLVGALGFISRHVAHAAQNERITSVVSRLNGVSTTEELASAGTFLLREKLITEAEQSVLRELRTKNQVYKLVFLDQTKRFYTAPFRVVEAFRDAKERVTSSATTPAPVSSDRQDASSDSEWETLRAQATLPPKDLFPDSKAEGLCVFDAISRQQNNLGPLAIRRTAEAMTLVKSGVSFLQASEGQTWQYGSGDIPSAIADFAQRAAGFAPRPQSQSAPRPSPAAQPATTASAPANDASRAPARRNMGPSQSVADRDRPRSNGRPRQHEPTIAEGLADLDTDVPQHIRALRQIQSEFAAESAVAPAPGSTDQKRAKAPKAKAPSSTKPRATARRRTAKATTATK